MAIAHWHLDYRLFCVHCYLRWYYGTIQCRQQGPIDFTRVCEVVINYLSERVSHLNISTSILMPLSTHPPKIILCKYFQINSLYFPLVRNVTLKNVAVRFSCCFFIFPSPVRVPHWRVSQSGLVCVRFSSHHILWTHLTVCKRYIFFLLVRHFVYTVKTVIRN